MRQIRKLGGKSSQFRKDRVVQTETRFLSDPFPGMETENKALSCFLRTVIHVCVPVHFAEWAVKMYITVLCGQVTCLFALQTKLLLEHSTFSDR